MRSSFFAFHVAVSGMNTARNGTNTAVHNMANMTTPGFSRQQVIQRASMPLSTFNRTGMVGTGSEIIGINQIRNPHLDTRYRNEAAVLGQQAVRNQQLTLLEASFGELNGLGINSSFEQFFDSLQYFHTNPSNPTHRNNFISSINVMTRSIQDRALAMQRQQADVNREIGGMATVINTLADQIANLNNQIQRLEIRGDRANDLRDQRNLLIDELSRLVNVDVQFTERPGGEEMSLHINGQQFIVHDQVNTLTTVRRTHPLHPHDAGGLYDLRIGNNIFRTDARGFSGELRGLFELRDGNAMRDENGALVFNRAIHDSPHPGIGKQGNPFFNGIGFKGIPYYMARLNDLMQTVANAVNFGIDRNGDPIPEMNSGHINGYNAQGERVNQPLFGFEGMNLPANWNLFRMPNLAIMIDNPPAGTAGHVPGTPPVNIPNPPFGQPGHVAGTGTAPTTIRNPAAGQPGHVLGTPPQNIANPPVGAPGHQAGVNVGDSIPNPGPGQPGHVLGTPPANIPNPAPGDPGHVPAPAPTVIANPPAGSAGHVPGIPPAQIVDPAVSGTAGWNVPGHTNYVATIANPHYIPLRVPNPAFGQPGHNPLLPVSQANTQANFDAWNTTNAANSAAWIVANVNPPAFIPNPAAGQPGHNAGVAVGADIPNPAVGDPGHVPNPNADLPNPFVNLPNPFASHQAHTDWVAANPGLHPNDSPYNAYIPMINNWAHPRNSINIFNINLNSAIVANPELIATATGNIGAGGESNNDLLLAFMNLRNNPHLFREGTINDFITSVMGELAVDALDAYRFVESQTLVMEVVQNQRLEIKGVDMNEEMTRMIFFQHHFQASSRMISAINDIYENMINRMGA